MIIEPKPVITSSLAWGKLSDFQLVHNMFFQFLELSVIVKSISRLAAQSDSIES